MSVCFNGNGVICLKKDKKNDFVEKFLKIEKDYNSDLSYMCNDDGLFQFINYARHYFMSDLIEMVKNNVDSIESGKLHFTCNDEDGSVKNPFPRYVVVEITDGQVFENTLETRMPCDWEHYMADNEWFGKKYDEMNKKTEKMVSELNAKAKEANNSNDDDLPF